MSKYNKEPHEDLNAGLPKNSRARKKSHKQPKLARGTKVASLVFTLLATFIGSNIAIYAANTYYNLDTGEIVVNNVQRVTEAIRATGGIMIGGTAGQSPGSGNTLEVAGGNILFSTGGTITQSGDGHVSFNGNVGMGGITAPAYKLDVGGTGIVARFAGRVQGADAVESNEFVTRGQLATGGPGGGIVDIGVVSLNNLDGALTINGQSGVLSVTTSGTDIALSIDAGGIGTTQLADGGVTTDKIFNEAVTAAKLADNAVIARTIASNAVTTGKIADEAVTAAKLADNAVITRTIQDGAVTNTKLQNDSITFNVSGALELRDSSNVRIPSGTQNIALGQAVNLHAVIDTGEGGAFDDFFRQGGNAFGESAVLGTTDSNDLIFRTGSGTIGETTRMTITAAGDVSTVGAFTSGGAFLASGTSAFTGLATFSNDIALAGGNRNIVATGGNLLLASSTNRIEFGNAQNFINTSNGNLTISGNFSLSGLTITDEGDLARIATGTGRDLYLSPDTGLVVIENNLQVGGSLYVGDGAEQYDLSRGSFVREVLPIFGYDLPVRCSGAGNCGSGDGQIMSHKVVYDAPAAVPGTYRVYNFTVHYSDNLDRNATLNETQWEVRDESDNVVDTFYLPASRGNDLDESAEVHTTGHVNIPESGEWAVYVTDLASGQEIQVNQIFLTATDVIIEQSLN